MSILKNIKKNKVKADFSSFTYTVAGRPKAGKTSLVYKTAVKKFGNADSLLLVAFENGYGALDGVNAIDIEDFEDFVDLVDELVENKDQVPYKMICLDTVDIMQDLATEYVVKKASRQDGKSYKKLVDIPWGGGWNMLADEISSAVNKLHKNGFSLWFVTHDKDKSFETREGLKYDKTTLSLTGKVRDVCLNMSDFIIFIELSKELDEDGKLVDKRKIHFRGDSSLECGSRLEDIPDNIDYSIDGFIDAVEGAVLKAYNGDKQAMENAKKEQAMEIENRAKSMASSIKEIDVKRNIELIDKIKASISKLDMTQVKPLMDQYGVTSFNDAEVIKTECLEKICSLIK